MTGQLTTLHVWRVPRRAVPLALARLAVDRFRLVATPGVRFGKLLGTGAGHGFGPTDADPTRYAALAVWDDPAAAHRFDASPVGRSWRRLAHSSAHLDLRPISSRGRWSRREPFHPEPGGSHPRSGGSRPGGGGPVLALTRARLRPSRALSFWRAIPPVAAELRAAPGVLARFGIGEAPVGWQGTVSVWRDATDLMEFAYRQPEHSAAIIRTSTARWYAEELFARFAVLDVRGDRSVLGWCDTEGRDRRQ